MSGTLEVNCTYASTSTYVEADNRLSTCIINLYKFKVPTNSTIRARMKRQNSESIESKQYSLPNKRQRSKKFAEQIPAKWRNTATTSKLQDVKDDIISVIDGEERDFPRGGADVLTPLEKKQLQVQATRDVLFEDSKENALCHSRDGMVNKHTFEHKSSNEGRSSTYGKLHGASNTVKYQDRAKIISLSYKVSNITSR